LHNIKTLLANPNPSAVSAADPLEYTVVVDSGYSHTTVTPLINGRPVQPAIRRLDIGGKHLTNYLAELLAIREVSLKEDPWIANQLKEKCCFVTDNLKRDIERTWRRHDMDPSIVVDCQLPDYVHSSDVIVKPYEPKDDMLKNKSNIATLGNERFQVPEILFNPGDIGMREGGLAEVILQSICSLPMSLQSVMLENVLVVGGNANIPGFIERLYEESSNVLTSD
jgi:actin-related protein 6